MASQRAAAGNLAPAFFAVRARTGLVAVLMALAGVGWWWTAIEMRGMDGGPWSGLGSLGWFIGVWVVMMAAMMFPSVAPTVALYSRMTRSRSPLSPLLFAGGYLITWAAAGVLAFAVGKAAGWLVGGQLAWSHAGRGLAGATLLLAGFYQLTPLKNACLGKCRSPLGLLLGTWRDGRAGAVQMGMRNGAWCVGCCWALMASLFALGVMSMVWMGVVAGFIALEKTIPWRGLATYGTAVALLTTGVLLLVAPYAVPGLTIPHTHGMAQMLAGFPGT